jgi:transmembrane sensor
MPRDADPAGDLARLRQATAWRVRLAEAGLETSPAFETWLTEDARHRAAWGQAQGGWALLGDPTSLEALAARRQALGRARNLGGKPPHGLADGPWRLVATLATLALAALLALVVWGQPQRYQTTPGERRVVRLADGSRVSLDAGSLLKVRLQARSRDLDLVRGQARFDVAHDASRPFQVHVRNQTIVALGTRFSIDLLGPTVTVTLLEGRVVVTGDGARVAALGVAPVRTVLQPGQRLVVATGFDPDPPRVEPVALDRATAWENGTLIFADEPLGLVTERVSRYSARSLTVADAQAASLRISGVFKAGDVATFLDTVTQYLPVEAASAGGRIELRSRPAPAP